MNFGEYTKKYIYNRSIISDGYDEKRGIEYFMWIWKKKNVEFTTSFDRNICMQVRTKSDERISL